jgi:DNA modification methylase
MVTKCLDSETGDRFAAYNADCVDILPEIPEESVGLTVFSPPFVDLYCYSDNDRDMGNCRTWDEFFTGFSFVANELFRVSRSGRLVVIHCVDIPAMKERDGYIGLKDFPGEIIRMFQSAGFIYHSRVTIWKDPLIEATRTKALGLMHKQLCKDSSMCRMGLPDYLIVVRKPGDNTEPISHHEGISKGYAGSSCIENIPGNRSHNIWRAYASPIWHDIRQTNTLNRNGARDQEDEKHICPLQLDTISRVVTLWSNPDDTVLTPFMGIGSEAYQALLMGRRAIGIELKPSYYRQALKNIRAALEHGEHKEEDMFGTISQEVSQ